VLQQQRLKQTGCERSDSKAKYEETFEAVLAIKPNYIKLKTTCGAAR